MMDSVAAAIGFAIFAWWISTGAVLALLRLPRRSHLAALAALALLAVLALIGLGGTRDDVTPAGAYAGFTYALIVWALIEAAFLFGYVTGPVTRPCPAGVTGWRRFELAFGTVAFHEISILVAGALMMAITWGAENQTGTVVFLILWAMRISAKLNIFLGAPRISAEFLPARLAYLATYFMKRRIGWFFVTSVSLASAALGLMVHAVASAQSGHDAIAMTLAASLLGLAILEHWFLVLPIPDAVLWRWASGTRRADDPLAKITPAAVKAARPKTTVKRG